MKKGYLYLENGAKFMGDIETKMQKSALKIKVITDFCGYEEQIQDEKNKEAMLLFVSPTIGAVGIANPDIKPKAKAVIVRELCHFPSNYTSRLSLLEYLDKNGVTMISDIDTKAVYDSLVDGKLKALITTKELDEKELSKILAAV